MIQPLSEVLSYRNDEIVLRFAEDFGVPPADAQDVFTETKRWLWLCARHRQAVQAQARGDGPVPVMLPLFTEAHAIDLMWHTFLLFTSEYASFCEGHFGFFIHHTPLTSVEKESWRRRLERDPAQAMQDRRSTLRATYVFIHDELGAEVLVRWCEEFPERFAALR